MLKDDHRTVEKLFKRFEKAGDKAYVEKRTIVDSIIEELSKHAAVEELLFYPVTRATVPETNDIALESLEEHHIVKWVLAELEKMDAADERFDAKVTVLIENVRHHVKEEEEEYFPQVRDELGRKALGELGDAMADARTTAPTHPHPRSPDTPPGNVVVGNAAGVVDRATDTVSGVAQGLVATAHDVIERVTGSKRPAEAPTGSPRARKVAAKARATGEDLADALVHSIAEAKAAGEATVKAAGRGASRTGAAAKTATKQTAASTKGTATTAKKGAARTTSAAKGAATTARKSAARTTSAAKGAATTAKRGASKTTATAKRAAKATGRAGARAAANA